MKMQKLYGLEPALVFDYFEKICSIPHGSGNTKAISDFLVEFAKTHKLSYIQDELNNIILFADGTCGLENHAPVILQGHMDMVCEKDANCSINMEKEGLDVTHDGEFVFANGTTLGGDDGIAVAYALAVLEDKSIPHPPLEVVITVDEETGMDGATGIDLSMLHGRKLLNMDSEDEGVFTVSCAGGAKSTIHFPIVRTTVEGTSLRLSVQNLTGGHSGVEIHKNRANANKVLGEFLHRVNALSPLSIAELSGGAKDNVIPRTAEAVIQTEASLDAVCKIAASLQNEIRETFDEPNALLLVETTDTASKAALTKDCSSKVIALLEKVPNGIRAWSQDIEGLVETSLNLGVLTLDESELRLTFAVRSSVNDNKEALIRELKEIAEEFGGSYTERGAYPAWEYRKDSVLRDTCVKVYRRLYGKEPKVEAIHAGLECGLLSEKLPDLDCISFGPQMHDIHTSREKLDIASTERTWNLLLEVLKEL